MNNKKSVYSRRNCNAWKSNDRSLSFDCSLKKYTLRELQVCWYSCIVSLRRAAKSERLYIIKRLLVYASTLLRQVYALILTVFCMAFLHWSRSKSVQFTGEQQRRKTDFFFYYPLVKIESLRNKNNELEGNYIFFFVSIFSWREN